MDSISKKYNNQKIILGLILTVLATLSLILSSKTTYASTYVMDKAGVLNQQTVEEITQINESDLSKVTGHPEIAVITVKTTGDEAIEDYAQEQAQKYHIGRKGWNNGILFVIATKDRKVRMDTGYGVEDVLPDDYIYLMKKYGTLLLDCNIGVFKTKFTKDLTYVDYTVPDINMVLTFVW